MILMPESLTAENGAKAALIGEFHETFTHDCAECGGDGLGYASPHSQGETPCEACDGRGELVQRIPVEWSTIKEIYARAVVLFGKPLNDAIAEAVAAERERCAKVCEGEIKRIWHEKGSSPEPETGGVSVGEADQEVITTLEELSEAIRSAAK